MNTIKTDYISIFEHICSIPHGSGNTRKIAEFCKEFAIYHGCKAFIDEIGNVIIYCDASIGYENKPTVILQGHTDMVCDKKASSNHNFDEDPLKLIYEDGFLMADGTTLGGDDGIAVAYALSIIANKDLKHPPLEILLTTDEETGLYGANALDGSVLNGRIMINIDSEEEGVLLSGCAGGVTATFKKDYITTKYSGTILSLKLDGLAGGHSGAEIHKRRLNAAKVLADVSKLIIENGGNLIKFVSGTKMNAIPFCGNVVLSVKNIMEAENIINDFSLNLSSKVISPDDKPNLSYEFIEAQDVDLLSDYDSNNLINFLCELPDGILSYTDSSEKLVETSLNLGVCEYNNGEFLGISLIRSSINGDLDIVSDNVINLSHKFNISVELSDRYPAWEFRKTSLLREKMCNIYKSMFNKELKVDVIHAGLECGILSDKLPGLDCVSIGPNIYDIHTFQEKLDLASAKRTYDFIINVLENL